MKLIYPRAVDAGFLLDMIFPQTCGACGTALLERGLHLCWDCRARLKVVSAPLCSCCGEPIHGRVDHAYVCHACSRRPPPFRRARAAVHYNEVAKSILIRFKYHHELWMEPFLVDLLESAIRIHYGDEHYDALCAVPLHPSRLRERGYNQSGLLGRALARRLDIPLLGRNVLRRIRRTPSQTRLTARRRIVNVKGAFEASRAKAWAGKTLLLVDDVMTTGATAGACAKALLEAGAKAVDVVTVARGI